MKTKDKTGITLIAVILTVIIMLILISVSINVVIESGLIKNTKNSAKEYKNATIEEAKLGEEVRIGNEVYEGIENYVENKPRRIPEEYKEVEYIDATKTGTYIDTNYYPNQDSGIIISFTPHTTGYLEPFGCENAYPFGYHMNNNWLINYITYGTKYRYIHYSEQPEVINVNRSKRNATVNGMNFEFEEQTFQSEAILKIGAYSKIIGDCIILENDVEIMHLVPCYRKADEEVGMYDLITETFFTNVGTGEFLKGPDT